MRLIFGAKIRCYCSFFQKDLVEFGVWYCEFPATIWVSARPMLFATMATLSISIVSMCLGSFTYSTFGSYRGQSFKLFYKKNQDLPQAGPPPSWNTETRRVTSELFQHYLDREDLKSCLWKRTVRMWEQCIISIGKRCQNLRKNRATWPKY